MLHTELPVYRDTYQLALKIVDYVREFPREYKYALGQDMKRDVLQLMRSIYRANKHKNRAEHLEMFLDELELLKLEICLCVDMKLLSIKKQTVLTDLMTRIGKLRAHSVARMLRDGAVALRAS